MSQRLTDSLKSRLPKTGKTRAGKEDVGSVAVQDGGRRNEGGGTVKWRGTAGPTEGIAPEG